MTRRRYDHSPALYLYTAATIVVGLLAFGWAAAVFPIDDAISLTLAGGSEGELLGLVFWVVVGLLGGLRVERFHGHAVLTFHIPFIIAATALGGPTAGAIVALVSTIEARELRGDVPWYGTAANHAALAIAAIAGGATMIAIRGMLVGPGLAPSQSIELVAIVLGSLVLTVIATAIAAGTVRLRDRLTVAEALRVFDTAYRTTAAAEVVLGWLLWLTYTTVGWWAALICTALVLVMWNSHDAVERARRDELTGLPTRASFTERLEDAIRAAERRGSTSALLGIDLDKFKLVNDCHGHAAGDGVLREVGRRIRANTRLTDAAVRWGGDEIGVLYTGIDDVAVAMRLAERLRVAICEPVELDDLTVRVGASIGVYLLDPAGEIPPAARLQDLVDRAMYVAKKNGGGVVLFERNVTARVERKAADCDEVDDRAAASSAVPASR